MAGPVILLGGDEFSAAYDDLDRELLAEAGTTTVTLLPTAAAYEGPQRLVDAATEHFATLGATVETVPVLMRRDAVDHALADDVRNASLIYLVDGSTMHIESVLKRSAVWEALVAAHERGAVVAASGASGRALCDPMVDPRGGGFAVGLGLVSGVSFVPNAERWSGERARRVRHLAPQGITLHAVASGEHIRIDG
ncbi:MAG: Type 1 glutamine amidotransferase-like domain-containing protein [Actinomycetota bacterium]